MQTSQRLTPWGGSLFAAVLFFGVFLFFSLLNLYLLWDGVTTQGVIIGEIDCYRSKNGTEDFNITVEFTDQTGQVNISTIGQCTDPSFYPPLGGSVTMVYAPIDPAINAPLDGLIVSTKIFLFLAFLCGLITVILLPFWRSKQKQDT